jgi:DNA invertase Pin-like site-specific DNA recombinase
MNTTLANANLDGRRVAIYMRSACAPQNNHLSTLDSQRRVLLDLTARHDLELAAEYCDVPASGLDAERPGLRRLLDDANAKHRALDIVLVESPCRLSRNLAEIAKIARELARLGIRLCWADEDRIVSAAPFSAREGD